MSCLLPMCQKESSCAIIQMKMCPPRGKFHVNQTRFEIEAQGNTEIAYCPELLRIHTGLHGNADEKS